MADAILNLVVIRSADLDRSAHFYTSLGLQFTRERHGQGPEHLAAVSGGTVFEVYPQGDASPTIGVRLGFRVASLSETLAAITPAGGVITTPARESLWGLQAGVTDPDGHKIELIEGL